MIDEQKPPAPPAEEPPPPQDSDRPHFSIVEGGAGDAMRPGNGFAGACQILREPGLRKIVLGTDEPIRFNLMTGTPMLGSEELDERDLVARFRERAELYLRIGKGDSAKGLRFAAETISSSLLYVARENQFHPVREYLDGLPDHVDCSGIIDRVCGEVLKLPEGLPRILMRKWAISCVARVMKPGCKADNILILKGEKGLGKSTFFSTIAVKDEWFADTYMDIENKDAYGQLHSVWIYEWAELDSMRSRPSSTVKAFLGSRSDNFREPYDTRPRHHPRSVVIVGTTNSDQFMAEAERRFWPLTIPGRIDLAQLRAERDGFWGEARAAWEAREDHHFEVESSHGKALISAQEEFTSEHPWDEPLSRWLAKGQAEITLAGALSAVGFGVGRPAGKREEMEMSDLLRGHGLVPSKSKITLQAGGRARVWADRSA